MNRQPILVFVLLFLLGASLVHAFDINVTANPIEHKIYRDEIAKYVLTIRNDGPRAEQLTFFTSDTRWRVYFNDNLAITVLPSKTINVTLELDPIDTIPDASAYGVPVTIRSAENKEMMLELPVQINSERFRTYAAAVHVSVTVGQDNTIDPSAPFDMRVKLLNQNPLKLDNLFVKISSSLFTDQFTTNLDGDGQVDKIIPTKLDPIQTKPQKFTVSVDLYQNDKHIGATSYFPMEIIESAPGFVRTTIKDEQTFLRKEYVVQLKNIGNVESTEEVALAMNLMQRLFTKSSLSAKYDVRDGVTNAVFTLTLAPGTGTELSVVQDYRWFFWTVVVLLVLLAASLTLYYVFRSAILIKRKIFMIKQGADGYTQLKVVVHVKNRTGKLVENVRVIERTPNIIEVSKEFSMGTLKPSKILANAHKGTLIRWDFSTLEPFEERIITYNLHSKLEILGEGQIKLPPTMVKYDSYGHTRTVTEHSLIHRAASSEDEE